MAFTEDSSSPVIRPHPVLPRYFNSEEARRSFVARIFEDAAAQYDRLESLISLGWGGWYRRQALRRAGLKRGMTVVDVAVGTGLLAREAVKLVGLEGKVIGIDPSVAMLRQVDAKLPIRLVCGRAEELPVAENSADFLSMGYALRHVSDLAAALRQFKAALKPGGVLLMLEITAPAKGLRRAIMDRHVRRMAPLLSKLLPWRKKQDSGAGKLLLEYYWDTVTSCIEPKAVMAAIESVGFLRPKWHPELGVFSEYTAVKG